MSASKKWSPKCIFGIYEEKLFLEDISRFSKISWNYPSEFYGPTGPEASQAQGFTFLVRDQKLGIKVASSQGPY